MNAGTQFFAMLFATMLAFVALFVGGGALASQSGKADTKATVSTQQTNKKMDTNEGDHTTTEKTGTTQDDTKNK